MKLEINIKNNNIQKTNDSTTNTEYSDGILTEINKNRKGLKPFKGKIFYISLALVITLSMIDTQVIGGSGIGIFIIFFVIFLRIASEIFFIKSKIELNYNLDEKISLSYDNLTSSFNSLNESKGLWQKTESEAIENQKYSGGASNSVTREKVTSKVNLAEFFNISNIKMPMLNLHDSKIYFMPDCILLEQGSLTEYSYIDLDVSFNYGRFNEEKPPKDAKIVDHTWQVVNKQGGPDKRIKDNKKIPVCLYDYVCMNLGDKTFTIIVSKPDVGKKLAISLVEYQKIISNYIF